MIALWFALLVAQASLPPPPPPPPPPIDGTRSYDAIDRLAFLEGEWVGTRDHGTSHPTTVSWRIGRFGAGSDHLLIGEIEHYGDPPVSVFDPHDPHQLTIVTYDAARGGYRVYAPGYYDLRGQAARGMDEPAALTLSPDGMTWTMPIDHRRERTIRVRGDRIEETLTYLPTGAAIYRTVLTRRPGPIGWGVRENAPPPRR